MEKEKGLINDWGQPQKTEQEKINEMYKQGQGNWYCDVTLCIAIKIYTKLRSILVLCEIGTARSAGFPLDYYY